MYAVDPIHVQAALRQPLSEVSHYDQTVLRREGRLAAEVKQISLKEDA
jgi:hypothetical protein